MREVSKNVTGHQKTCTIEPGKVSTLQPAKVGATQGEHMGIRNCDSERKKGFLHKPRKTALFEKLGGTNKQPATHATIPDGTVTPGSRAGHTAGTSASTPSALWSNEASNWRSMT